MFPFTAQKARKKEHSPDLYQNLSSLIPFGLSTSPGPQKFGRAPHSFLTKLTKKMTKKPNFPRKSEEGREGRVRHLWRVLTIYRFARPSLLRFSEVSENFRKRNLFLKILEKKISDFHASSCRRKSLIFVGAREKFFEKNFHKN